MFHGYKPLLSNQCIEMVYALWTAQESMLPRTIAEGRYECPPSPNPAIVKCYSLQSRSEFVTLRITLYCQALPKVV